MADASRENCDRFPSVMDTRHAFCQQAASSFGHSAKRSYRGQQHNPTSEHRIEGSQFGTAFASTPRNQITQSDKLP
jgi:hypothetical protein